MVKNPPANARDEDLISGSERSPGEGNGIPLQYSRLGSPMERRTWPSTVHRVAKESETTLATKQQQQHVIVINVIPKVPLSLLLKVIQKNKPIF